MVRHDLIAICRAASHTHADRLDRTAVRHPNARATLHTLAVERRRGRNRHFIDSRAREHFAEFITSHERKIHPKIVSDLAPNHHGTKNSNPAFIRIPLLERVHSKSVVGVSRARPRVAPERVTFVKVVTA